MQAIDRGVSGQKSIINIMNDTLKESRPTRKENGPVLENLDIPSNKHTILLGNGGVNIKKITAETGKELFIKIHFYMNERVI